MSLWNSLTSAVQTSLTICPIGCFGILNRYGGLVYELWQETEALPLPWNNNTKIYKNINILNFLSKNWNEKIRFPRKNSETNLLQQILKIRRRHLRFYTDSLFLQTVFILTAYYLFASGYFRFDSSVSGRFPCFWWISLQIFYNFFDWGLESAIKAALQNFSRSVGWELANRRALGTFFYCLI